MLQQLGKDRIDVGFFRAIGLTWVFEPITLAGVFGPCPMLGFWITGFLKPIRLAEVFQPIRSAGVIGSCPVLGFRSPIIVHFGVF